MRYILYLLLGVFTLVSCGNGQDKNSSEVRELVMEAAPKGVLESDNKKIGIYDFDGFEELLKRKDEKVYVVNFWATWCKPCVEELPYFEQLNDKYASSNVEVVLVSLDFPSRAEELLLTFVEKKNIKSEVLLLDDPRQNTWIPKVDAEWSGAIPATLIFNKDRKEFYEKSFNFNELESELLSFIN